MSVESPIQTDRVTESSDDDGRSLNREFEAWKGSIYAEFPGVGIAEAMTNPDGGNAKFVAVAAMVQRRKVVAIWVAETTAVERPDRPGHWQQSIRITSRVVHCRPEELPEPFRAISLMAFPQ